MANDRLMGSLDACRGGNEELKVPPLFCSLPEHHFLRGGNFRTGRLKHVGLYPTTTSVEITILVVIYATYLIFVTQKNTSYVIIAHIFACKTSYFHMNLV